MAEVGGGLLTETKHTFDSKYRLGAEMGKFPPFVVKEVFRRHDNKQFLVKVMMKVDHSSDFIETVLQEVTFWRKIIHPNICHIFECFDEDCFIYILYQYPRGGSLGVLAYQHARAYTEGFARHISRKILQALSFIHSNGIVHGSCTPENIVFMQETNKVGWIYTVQLSFIYTGGSLASKGASEPKFFYHDLQDFAYSLYSLMRSKHGVRSDRDTFDPNAEGFRDFRNLDHLSDEFYDFIQQLFNSSRTHKTANKMMDHLWLLDPDKPFYSSSIPSLNNLSQEYDHPEDLVMNEDYNSNICGWVQYKVNQRNWHGGRSWINAYAVLTDNVIFFYEDDAKKTNEPNREILPRSISLKDKCVEKDPMSKHPNTLALSSTSTYEIVMWLRFETADVRDKWKQCCLEAVDPSRQNVIGHTIAHHFNHGHSPSDGPKSSDTTVPPSQRTLNENTTAAVTGTDGSSEGDFLIKMSKQKLRGLGIGELRKLSGELGLDSSGIRDKETLRELIEECPKLNLVDDFTDDSCISNRTETLAQQLSDGQDYDHKNAHKLVNAVRRSAEKYSIHLHVQTAKCKFHVEEKDWRGIYLDSRKKQFLSPLPSDTLVNVHPSMHWENRANELGLILSTGVPVDVPVEPGHTWFIVDASWYRHWTTFVSSHRRMASPGPIDNLWMINYKTGRPFAQLVEETDTKHGDFRRVTPLMWELFEEWYGGGPCIKVTGPPIEDSRRWDIRYLPPPKYLHFEKEQNAATSITRQDVSAEDADGSNTDNRCMHSAQLKMLLEGMSVEEMNKFPPSLKSEDHTMAMTSPQPKYSNNAPTVKDSKQQFSSHTTVAPTVAAEVGNSQTGKSPVNRTEDTKKSISPGSTSPLTIILPTDSESTDQNPGGIKKDFVDVHSSADSSFDAHEVAMNGKLLDVDEVPFKEIKSTSSLAIKNRNIAGDFDNNTNNDDKESGNSGGVFSQPKNKAPEIVHGISEHLATPPPQISVSSLEQLSKMDSQDAGDREPISRMAFLGADSYEEKISTSDGKNASKVSADVNIHSTANIYASEEELLHSTGMAHIFEAVEQYKKSEEAVDDEGSLKAGDNVPVWSRNENKEAKHESASPEEQIAVTIDDKPVEEVPKVKTKELTEELRSRLQARGSSGMSGFIRKFRIMDDDNDSVLTFTEFEKGLKDCSLDFSDDQIVALFNKFDKDKTGLVSLDEFLNKLQGKQLRKDLPNIVAAATDVNLNSLPKGVVIDVDISAPKCGFCGLDKPLMKFCRRCHRGYCSQKCQVSDWKEHKLSCSKMEEKTAVHENEEEKTKTGHENEEEKTKTGHENEINGRQVKESVVGSSDERYASNADDVEVTKNESGEGVVNTQNAYKQPVNNDSDTVSKPIFHRKSEEHVEPFVVVLDSRDKKSVEKSSDDAAAEANIDKISITNASSPGSINMSAERDSKTATQEDTGKGDICSEVISKDAVASDVLEKSEVNSRAVVENKVDTASENSAISENSSSYNDDNDDDDDSVHSNDTSSISSDVVHGARGSGRDGSNAATSIDARVDRTIHDRNKASTFFQQKGTSGSPPLISVGAESYNSYSWTSTSRSPTNIASSKPLPKMKREFLPIKQTPPGKMSSPKPWESSAYDEDASSTSE